MRLDKYLSDMSLGTRSEVKILIKKGMIKVNDEIIKKTDHQVNENDRIYFKNELIEYQEFEYYILNKPAGYLSATFDKKDPTVMELINSKRKDLSPIGRLDKDSEGLLLISNDGKLNHYLTSPRNNILKTYYVELDKDIPKNAEEQFDKPMDLGDFIAKPAKYEKINDRSAYLTISEGKFHQVKRMFEKIGCTVTYLKRISFGPLKLGKLDIGEYRALDGKELEILYNISNKEETWKY